jgi:hypothetical protein
MAIREEFSMRHQKAIILFIIMLGYLLMGGIALYRTWTVPALPTSSTNQNGESIVVDPAPPEFTDPFLLVATTLSGIMVSAFASAMGIPAPGGNSNSTYIRRLQSSWKRFATLLDPSLLVNNLYIWAQILMGLACLTTWIARPAVTPAVVLNIASLFMTMVASVAMSAIPQNNVQPRRRH